MALPSARYAPRRPTEGAVYQIVREHFETFRAQAARLRDGEGLPRFVEQEICSSCGGRRMAERAAHVIDRLLPDVPVRQCRGPQRGNRAGVEWVLSLPYWLRYQLAWDHELCRAIVAVFIGTVLGDLRARAATVSPMVGAAPSPSSSGSGARSI